MSGAAAAAWAPEAVSGAAAAICAADRESVGWGFQPASMTPSGVKVQTAYKQSNMSCPESSSLTNQNALSGEVILTSALQKLQK